MKPMIALQPFGRTGHESTRLLFGAAAIGNVDQDEADQTMELIREHGINHIDTAASYGDAELRLGPWMETRRAEFWKPLYRPETRGWSDSSELLVMVRPLPRSTCGR